MVSNTDDNAYENPVVFGVYCTYLLYDQRTFEGLQVYWWEELDLQPTCPFSLLDPINNKMLSYRRDSARPRCQSLHRSRSFKVTDSGTNRKLICDFLLVNTNLYPISPPFLSYCRLLVKFTLALATGLRNLVSRSHNYRYIVWWKCTSISWSI